jgi:hypothetical protein
VKKILAGLSIVLLPLVAVAQSTRVDAAFEHFWAAATPEDAAARVDEVVASGVSFDEALRRLRAGRPYQAQAPGMVQLTNRTADGVEHHFAVTIPDGYDASKRYQVRVQLHGGIMNRPTNVPPPNAGGIGALAGDEPQIYVVPFAWEAAPWWSDDQLLNLRTVLDMVKRRYNVDENRVVLSGVSDGGTGAYYVAMRDTTPYASFLPLNGYWGILAVHDLQVDGPLFPGNMRNKPFFIINGERDPLYPPRLVEPAIAHYRKMGLTFDYEQEAGAGHNTRWWPRVKGAFESFVAAHPRRPLPDTVTWEAVRPDAFSRAHWIVIDAIGRYPGDSVLDDPNLVASEPREDFGVRGAGNRITRVTPGSNADHLGLKPGDAIVRLNDETVHVSVDIQEIFNGTAAGSPITLLVARDNAPLELKGVYAPTETLDPPHPMFDRGVPSGRVDATRDGNTVTVKTRGVTRFTILLSPDQFDFTKPVSVIVNGAASSSAVRPDLRTLMRWAARDNDRTMLFGAELNIALTGNAGAP